MANRWGEGAVIEWQDKKRILGMPISFTKYSLVSSPEWTKIFVRSGLLFTTEEEINLYRIYDISVSSSLGEKLFGLGTITLYSKDESTPVLQLLHIKNARNVRNLLANKIEEEKIKRGFRVAEFN
jgi:membrane protein YdbS with pleckstrin-like domain